MTFAFEKLVVYQKSVDFADSVCVATEQFQRGYGFLVDQLNRAALSNARGSWRRPSRRAKENSTKIASVSNRWYRFPHLLSGALSTSWVLLLYLSPRESQGRGTSQSR
jgi:hypothetical protein